MSDLNEEIALSIKENLSERLNSPLLSSLLSFWLIFNWKGLYFLFHPNEKLSSIEKLEYFESTYINLIDSAALPIISSLAFVWLYPFAAQLAFSHWKKSEQKKTETLNSIRKASTVSGEEHSDLQEKFATLKHDYRRLKSDHEKDLDILRDMLKETRDSAESDTNKMKASFQKLEDEYKSKTAELVSKISLQEIKIVELSESKIFHEENAKRAIEKANRAISDSKLTYQHLRNILEDEKKPIGLDLASATRPSIYEKVKDILDNQKKLTEELKNVQETPNPNN